MRHYIFAESVYFLKLYALFLLLVIPIHGLKNLVLVSAPGSGKGTLSEHLVERYGYEHICLGDIIRQEIAAQTPLGMQAKPLLECGGYVQDQIALDIIAPRIMAALNQKKSFILDGFPRSITSFSLLHAWFQGHVLGQEIRFVQLKVCDAVCVDRVLHRRVCMQCLRVYNSEYVWPLIEDLCDRCGSPLSIRSSDKLHIIQRRLEIFHDQIEPVLGVALDYYPIVTIDADRSLVLLRVEYDGLIV